MPQNILNRILETKRKEVAALRESVELSELKSQAESAPRPRNFYAAVTKPPVRALNLIAEIKRASPSAGIICEDFDPPRIARQYAQGGADALSVLTDEHYFKGALEYIGQVKEVVDLPVLRKDFIIDPLQVYQSRIAGADAILLIAAALEPSELTDLMILATELKMTVLVEVHNSDELMQVRSMVGFPHPGFGLLGINNRDLTTFNVDIDTSIRMRSLAGENTPVVSESGIKTNDDVNRLATAGVQALLVGETLMRSGDPAAAIEELLGPPSQDTRR